MKPLGFSCAGFTLSSGYCSAGAAQPLYGSQQQEPRVQFRNCLALIYFKLQPGNRLPSSSDLPESCCSSSPLSCSNAGVSSCVTEYLLWALLAVCTGCLASSQLSVLATLIQATSYRLCGHSYTTNSISCPYCSCSQQVFARFVPVLMEWLFSPSAVDLEMLQVLSPSCLALSRCFPSHA